MQTLIPKSTTEQPLFRLTLLLLFLTLLISGLNYAASMIVPLSFAALIAMLMLPISRFLEKHRFPRALAIIMCLLIIVSVIAGFIFLFSTQIMGFSEDLPMLKEKLIERFDLLTSFIQKQTNISAKEQNNYFKDQINGLTENLDVIARGVLVTTTGTLATIFIIVIYIFFFLFYRTRIRKFILMIADVKNHEQTNTILVKTSSVTQSYLSGVLIVMVILSTLNSVGFLILGIPHAIFFGCLAGFLNIIPYIGVLIGSLFPIAMALLTKDSLWYAVATLGVCYFTQFLENNFLTPSIVGSKVKINPFATIIALLVGGQLWGVAGMILFIPFLGILKIVFDEVDDLKPYGYLIGDNGDAKSTAKTGDQIIENEENKAEKKSSIISFIAGVFKR